MMGCILMCSLGKSPCQEHPNDASTSMDGENLELIVPKKDCCFNLEEIDEDRSDNAENRSTPNRNLEWC
jgi:hypothetical protein